MIALKDLEGVDRGWIFFYYEISFRKDGKIERNTTPQEAVVMSKNESGYYLKLFLQVSKDEIQLYFAEAREKLFLKLEDALRHRDSVIKDKIQEVEKEKNKIIEKLRQELEGV